MLSFQKMRSKGQYCDVPAGGVLNVLPAIPTGKLYRVKQIQGVSKQTLKLVP